MNMEVLKGKTLLIVDDEPDLREPLVMEFESLGCRVFQAGNGRAALEIVKREKIDAVVSDIRMPGGDGVELLREIKELHHEFPMVMLITGFSDLSREEAYHLGAEAILAKPFDLDEIDLAVTRILTPREKRWDCNVDPDKLRRTIEREYVEFAQTLEQGDLSLGRGGFFYPLAADHPAPGQTVAIKIKFTGGDFLLFEGSGTVRWVRREQAPGLPPGIGIEFECLGDETRRKVLEVTNSVKTKPFIPRS